MEARAVSRHLRVAPRKARLVADLVRGRRVGDALIVLEHSPKRVARSILKTIKSVVANAENTQRVDVDRLYIKTIRVDGGPMWKRFMPRAQGRATRVRKRTSHITVVVDQKS
jgi:large subunit ribosomal protein L22